MKKNKGKEERRKRGENQGNRRIPCPGDTLLVTKPALPGI
jgi:hypothetical protein